MPYELGEMHWHGGLVFKRMPDGSVRIRQEPDPRVTGIVETTDPKTVIAVIPPNEWASLILHVADHGPDTNRVTIQQAIDFHG